MIRPEIAELFPPHWAAESRDTEWIFPWTSEPVPNADPVLLLGDRHGRALLSAVPSPGGSWVRAEPDGVALHLSAADARSIKGREVVFALWAQCPPDLDLVDPFPALARDDADAFGQIVVSDWAATPHAGTA